MTHYVAILLQQALRGAPPQASRPAWSFWGCSSLYRPAPHAAHESLMATRNTGGAYEIHPPVLVNEYKAIFTDGGVLLIFAAGLTIYTMIYPLPYSPEVVKELPVIPIDQDHSSLSRKLMRWAEATEEIHLTQPATDLADAQQRVLNGEAEGIFVIPQGFRAATSFAANRPSFRSTRMPVYFLIYRRSPPACIRRARPYPPALKSAGSPPPDWSQIK